MEDLPLEIISNMLSRLPGDSVSQCRCVCQSWYTTTKDRCFVDDHLHHQVTTQTNIVGQLLLLKNHDTSDCELHYTEYDGDKDPEQCYKVVKINHPPLKHVNCKYSHKSIVDSCNGLICLSDPITGDPNYVCNPLTRECVNLPKYRNHCVKGVLVRGFGYLPCANEYKMVRIFRQFYFCKGETSNNEVQVYTLGKDTSWRSIGKVPFSLDERSYGVLVNGTLHWMTQKSEDTEYKIVAFDLADEKFRVLSSPPCFTIGREHSFSVQVLGGCLCVTEQFVDGHVEIWVLKNYMNRDSWTKEFVINKDSTRNEEGMEGGGFDQYRPIEVTKDGKILLWYNDVNLISYDPKSGTKVRIVDHGKGNMLKAAAHMKSFISLKSLGEDSRMIGAENRKRKR